MARVEYSPNQKELASLMRTTRTEAEVKRRRILSDGTPQFYNIVRPTSPVDFAINNEEFVLKLHSQPGHEMDPLSPYFINLRNLPDFLMSKVGLVIAQIPLDERPDVMAGIPKAGIPIVEAVHAENKIPIVDIFGKEDTDALHRKVIATGEQGSGEGRKLLLIDDLITAGGTKKEAIEAAKSQGYDVMGVAVLVDREQGGEQDLAKDGVKLYSAFRVSGMFGYYDGDEDKVVRISNYRYRQAMRYLRAEQARAKAA